jgi:hypothetical protein
VNHFLHNRSIALLKSLRAWSFAGVPLYHDCQQTVYLFPQWFWKIGPPVRLTDTLIILQVLRPLTTLKGAWVKADKLFTVQVRLL